MVCQCDPVFEELSNSTQLKLKVRDEDIKTLFHSLDINNSGKIDYSEFLAVFVLNGIYQYESYLKDVFRKLDADKDGKITVNELQEFFKTETPFLFNQDINECMKEIDLNKDGVIDLEELLTHMRSKRSQTMLAK